MHYDFTPTNLLSDGARITGIIDINARATRRHLRLARLVITDPASTTPPW
jgi:Ser/Thr protein kinase RdoA (MazF antagonist)